MNNSLSNTLNAVSQAYRNLTEPCFLISRFLKDISGIFMAKINTKLMKMILKLGQGNLIFGLA